MINIYFSTYRHIRKKVLTVLGTALPPPPLTTDYDTEYNILRTQVKTRLALYVLQNLPSTTVF